MFKGYAVGVLGRFIFAVLSGVVFFADYTPEGMSPLGYSAAYNGSYLAAEAVLTVVVLLIPAVRAAQVQVGALPETLRMLGINDLPVDQDDD